MVLPVSCWFSLSLCSAHMFTEVTRMPWQLLTGTSVDFLLVGSLYLFLLPTVMFQMYFAFWVAKCYLLMPLKTQLCDILSWREGRSVESKWPAGKLSLAPLLLLSCVTPAQKLMTNTVLARGTEKGGRWASGRCWTATLGFLEAKAMLKGHKWKSLWGVSAWHSASRAAQRTKRRDWWEVEQMAQRAVTATEMAKGTTLLQSGSSFCKDGFTDNCLNSQFMFPLKINFST